jgi:hypothetical protein
VVRIRFIVREAPWEAWEVVSLPALEAAKFLRRGVAEPMDEAGAGNPRERVPRVGAAIVDEPEKPKEAKRARRG